MESVPLYDIASSSWYIQQTLGDVPRWRMAGCSVVVAAPDNSSFSMWVLTTAS